MTQHYDLIAIGAGTGGLNVAVFGSIIGLKVLLIDKTDRNIGGDCLNFGCVPSKALIHTARLAHAAKEAQKFGLKTSGTIDLAKVSDYVVSKREHIRKHENAAHFRKKGIDVELGTAKFVNKNTIEVNGKQFSASKIVLATGARPRKLSIPGVEKVKFWTNEEIFEQKSLPKHMLIIGGGPIGIELGQSFLRLGSKVTILQNMDQFLPKEDPDIANVLYERLKKEGMDIIFNAQPESFPTPKSLQYTTKDGKKKTIAFDNVLISIGREINIEGLDLEKAGIDMDGRRLKIDDYLRTTNKNIYAVGDVVGSYQFTHAAELHASVVINNLVSPLKKKVNYDHLSWVTYTSPEIGTFGLAPKALKEKGQDFRVLDYSFVADDRAIVDENTDSRMKMYVDKKGKILGGTMIAEHAGEIIQELVLANSAGLTTKALFNKVHAYPTASRVNRRIVVEDMGSKLTTRVKGILRFMYKLLNR